MSTEPKPAKGHRKAILASLTMTVLAATLFVGAPPAGATSSPVRLADVSLVAIDLEDWWPDWVDEISVNYDRQQVGSVLNCQQYKRVSVVGAVFSNFLTVELFEWDRGSPRPLGEHTIPAAEVGQGEKTKTFGHPTVAGADFSYVLRYTVVRL